MSNYHEFVFDIQHRKFIGDFEHMYQADLAGEFDSWHQDDQRHLCKKLIFALLDGYNFNSILDLGCGKGSITHQLKKKNNRVVGVDISPTAIKVAQERFPDINFLCADLNAPLNLFSRLPQQNYDLIFISEILSYLQNWSEILLTTSRHCQYLLVSLFIPENPIGFVKDS